MCLPPRGSRPEAEARQNGGPLEREMFLPHRRGESHLASKIKPRSPADLLLEGHEAHIPGLVDSKLDEKLDVSLWDKLKVTVEAGTHRCFKDVSFYKQ